VKVLLDSGAIRMFMSKSLAQKIGYRLIKSDQSLLVSQTSFGHNYNGT